MWLWPGRGLVLCGGVITAPSTLQPLCGPAHFWAGCKFLVQKCWFYAVILWGLAVAMPIVFVIIVAVFVEAKNNF